MKIMDYVQIILRRWWLIVITTVVAFAVVFLGSSRLEPTYTATASIRVQTFFGGSEDYVSYDLRYTERVIATYAAIATTGDVMDKVKELLDVDDITASIEVNAVPNTELMEIVVEASEAEFARDVANALATVLVEDTIKYEIENDITDGRQLTSIISEASTPRYPSGVSMKFILAFSLVLGVGGGVGLAILLESFDTRLHWLGRIESVVGTPVLAIMPRFGRKALKSHTAAYDAPMRLSLRLFPAHAPSQLKTLAIASARNKEGKSTITHLLAYALSSMGRKVIVIDADLQQPNMHTIFDVTPGPGLSDVLMEDAELDDVIQDVPDQLLIRTIPAGSPVPNFTYLLASGRMKSILDTLSTQADVVLLNLPPILVASDGLLLSTLADGVILVTKLHKTPAESAIAACDQLHHAGANLLGTVVNGAPKASRFGLPISPFNLGQTQKVSTDTNPTGINLKAVRQNGNGHSTSETKPVRPEDRTEPARPAAFEEELAAVSDAELEQ